jgi:3-dehydroquinate dehydratase
MPNVNTKIKISVLVSTTKNKKLITLRERNIGHSQKHKKTYALHSLRTKAYVINLKYIYISWSNPGTSLDRSLGLQKFEAPRTSR